MKPVLDAASRRYLPWVVALAFFMQTLDTTILNTALPGMARDLGENPLQMQSAVIAYMLTVALLIPASGWLADRFGTRTLFLWAIALFSLGSLACASSGSLQTLVMARVVQGALTRQIADELSLGLRSVKACRASVMDKMGAASLPDLVRLAAALPGGR